MREPVEIGHVVRDTYIGHTHVRICDDFYRDKTQKDVDAILERIAAIASDARAKA